MAAEVAVMAHDSARPPWEEDFERGTRPIARLRTRRFAEMIRDASATISMLIAEPGWEELLRKIESADFVAIGAPTMFETALALSNKLESDALPTVQAMIRRTNGNVLPCTRERMHAAIDGFRRFGKGRRKAKLNLGDCMTTAFACVAGMPLLFTTGDFIHTDIERA